MYQDRKYLNTVTSLTSARRAISRVLVPWYPCRENRATAARAILPGTSEPVGVNAKHIPLVKMLDFWHRSRQRYSSKQWMGDSYPLPDLPDTVALIGGKKRFNLKQVKLPAN
jgi:hypothetical protein